MRQAARAKMLALELAPQKIRVNVVCPGAIATEIDDNTERRELDDVALPGEISPWGKSP